MTERIEVPRTIRRPRRRHLRGALRPAGPRRDRRHGHAAGRRRAIRSGRSATASSCTWTASRSTTFPLGKYDVTVSITEFEQDRLIAWTIFGQLKPDIGHVYGYRLEPADDGTLVTSFYDWSDIDQHWRDANIFPIVSELALRATLGILDRTVRRGYPRASTTG